MTLEEFDETCDRFTNKRLFRQDGSGNLLRDRTGKLVRVNDDNP
jgi:hypothetical protein